MRSYGNAWRTPSLCGRLAKGRTTRKRIGRGGAVEVQNLFAQGKLNEKKIHARQLNLKNIHATA